MRLPILSLCQKWPYYVLFRRFKSTNAPRVRFAPSPTGFLHLGGLRTALYNYLFAKSRGGTFILRIEDTDQSRKVEGAVEALVSDLEWAGISCDEGPHVGGEYGPYTQSERLETYQESIKELLHNGSAYHCFCTDRRLNILRRDALKARQVPKYDNRCRHLSKDEVKKKLDSGAPHCIRFKLTSDCTSFHDLVYGGIAYDVSATEGDPVLLKGDGYPTYHLASVCDDRRMRVTHVLRGVEWQISTTKHLLLYRAFGWTPPQFGHLPLIVNADGSKLSKRQGDVKVEDYRAKGTFPLSLVNYIAASGGGFSHAPGAGLRLRDMRELADEFNISQVSPHPSRLNPALLDECNRQELRRRLRDPAAAAALVHTLGTLVRGVYPSAPLDLPPDHVLRVLQWASARVSTLEELVTPKYGFVWVLPTGGVDGDTKALIPALVDALKPVDFEKASLQQALRGFAEERGVEFPALMKGLRAALSGLPEGPGVAEMMALLGKERALRRMQLVLE